MPILLVTCCDMGKSAKCYGYRPSMQPAMTCAASSRSRETADSLLMRGIVGFGGDGTGTYFVLLMVT